MKPFRLLFQASFILIYSLLISLSVKAQLTTEWAQCYGGNGISSFSYFTETSDRGYIIVGRSRVCIEPGDTAYSNEVYLVKTDSVGNSLWEVCLGGSDDDAIEKITQTEDGGYIAIGKTKSNDRDVAGNHGELDIWIVKINSDGILQWQKCVGGSASDDATDFIEKPFGYIIVGGTTSLDGDFSNTTPYGNNDGIMFAVDTMGNVLWQRRYGDANSQLITQIIDAHNGGYILAGRVNNSGGSFTDCWLMKVDTFGVIDWEVEYVESGLQVINDMKPTYDNGYVIVGAYSNTNLYSNSDYFILKFDLQGDFVWKRTYGGDDRDIAYSVVTAADGGFILCGWAESNNASVNCSNANIASSAWLIKLDDFGFIQWQQCDGSYSQEVANWMMKLEDGGIGVVGTQGSDNLTTCTNGNFGGASWFYKLEADPYQNIIHGNVFKDTNSNCMLDTNEIPIAQRIIQALPGPRYATTDANGNYRLWVDTGTHLVSLAPIPYWATNCPSGYNHFINFPNNGMSIDSIDFSSYISNYCANLEVGVGTALQRRCFSNNHVVASVCNTGTIAADSVVLSVHFPSELIPLSATAPWTGGVNGVYNFQVGDLQPGQCFQVSITDSVSCDANLGDVPCIFVDAAHQSNDCNTANTFTATHHCEAITGSFDPNDKQVASQNYQQNGYLFSEEFMQDDTLSYRIRFQNTGTDTAFTVIVRDTISPWLDPTTIVTEVTSHPYSYRLFGQGIAEWKFDNILLPDSFVNEPLSHGFIKYRILPQPNIPPGTEVYNSAAIYFDYNEPVITNQTVSTLSIITSQQSAFYEQGIKLYPNPATYEVVIETQSDKNSYSLYDVSGRQVMSGIANTSKFNLNVSSLSKGVYFLQVSSGDKSVYGKLVKE